MNTIPTLLAALGAVPLLGLTAVLGQAQPGGSLPPTVQERGGLPHVFAKLKAGKSVTIAYFGGSITAGAGASDGEKTSYRALVGQWFTTTFPQASVTNVNAAIGGTGSDLAAFRLKRDVLAHHPDLVFVEYAVNDDGTPDAMVDRAMEGIVRQIRRADPVTDVCFVYTFVPAWLPEIETGTPHRTVKLHEAVAEHYGIPSVNFGPPVAQALTAGTLTQADFTKDGTHPTDTGYKLYADTLIGFLEAQRTQKNGPSPFPSLAPVPAAGLAGIRSDDRPECDGTARRGLGRGHEQPDGQFPRASGVKHAGCDSDGRLLRPHPRHVLRARPGYGRI